jgi:hypothetical protein
MNTNGNWDYSPIYFAWFGIPVLLFLSRECRVPITCNIVGESVSAVRIRLQAGLEMDVSKQSIIAIEEGTIRWESYKN